MIGYLTQDYSLINAFQTQAVGRARNRGRVANRVFKMAPKLSDYFRDGEIIASKGALDRPISGLVMDSRRVVPGNLFFALPGLRADGSSFIDEAINRGAVAIVRRSVKRSDRLTPLLSRRTRRIWSKRSSFRDEVAMNALARANCMSSFLSGSLRTWPTASASQ